MADYISSFTGTDIDTKLSSIPTIQSSISAINTTLTTLSNDISSLQTQINTLSTRMGTAESQITTLTSLSTKTVTPVAGVTVTFKKIGRIVYVYANADATATWNTGTNVSVSSFGNAWMPIYACQTPSLGYGIGTKFFTVDESGNLYHTGGSNITSSNKRVRFYMCYITKE